MRRITTTATVVAIAALALVLGQSASNASVGPSRSPATAHSRASSKDELVPFKVALFTGPYLTWAGIQQHKFGNLKISSVVQDSGPASLPLLVSGTIQGISDISQPPIGIAFARHIGVKVVWINGVTENKLLVQPGSGIKTPADLKGKRIGLPAGSLEETFLQEYLASGGLTLKDINLVDLGPADLPSAWASKAIDATYMFEPVADEIQGKGGVLLQDRYAPDMVIVSSKFAAQHRSTVQAYVCGMAATHAAFFKNPTLTDRFLAKKFGMTLPAVAKLLPPKLQAPVNQNTRRWMGTSKAPSALAPLLVSYGHWLVSQGQASTVPTLKQAQAMFDPSYAQYVAEGKCAA